MKAKSARKQYDFNPLFLKFISDSKSGKRVQKNGKKVRSTTIQNYQYLHRLLVNFQISKQIDLRVMDARRLTKRELETETNYWKKFYRSFTDYLYYDLGHYDNYVGSNIKMLRTFFNYLTHEKGLQIGTFHKNFYVRHEEIPIVVLSPEQLNFLIYDNAFEQGISDRLRRTKDILVFGCTVALRVSDLLGLTGSNLEIQGNSYYLKVQSKKTDTFTRIKLPDYAVKVIQKYHRRRHIHLLPQISNYNLNKNIKLLCERAGWTHTVSRSRSRKGILEKLENSSRGERKLRYCDLLTSHTMRRTAITTMLSLGMSEYMVRKISGHAANSKEFFRYVSLAQSYIDQETEAVFKRLESTKFIKTEW